MHFKEERDKKGKMATGEPIARQGKWKNRKASYIENNRVAMAFLPGGGHIASFILKQGGAAGLNPLWESPWPSMEPEDYLPGRDDSAYGGPPEGRILACRVGHNLCFDYFGAPTPEEAARGYGVHGEAPVLIWDVQEDIDPSGKAKITALVTLPMSHMSFQRTLTLAHNRQVVQFDSEIKNLNPTDHLTGWQEHPTYGPPFLENGVTIFDANATWSMVYPTAFASRHRLKIGAEFTWPKAPGADGKKVDLRVFPEKKHSGDFTTQLMNAKDKHGWFTALHPGRRLLTGYIWKQTDFPWLGQWEENFDRTRPPWAGKSLARGMEFGWSPYTGHSNMLRLGTLKGQPTLRRLAPGQIVSARFYSFITEVPNGCEGVKTAALENKAVVLHLRNPKIRLELPFD